MNIVDSAAVSRRSFLAASCGAAVAAVMPSWSARAGAASFELSAAPGQAGVVGPPYSQTDVWCYSGQVPGPEIRVRQGERLRVVVKNRLAEGTTVHWHGVRVPNAMDGVPHLTQAPIAPGEQFVYQFDLPDAGTYWYHPHQRSFEQVGRGLYGPLIVEERQPILVDRDVTWVLGDWRLRSNAQISDDFGNRMDTAMAGRVGNTVTVNGRIQDAFLARSGERLRLRLINAATARIFGLEFQGHQPQIVALDGQPVAPHAPETGRIVLGPAMRADLVIDMMGAPGETFRVIDSFYRGLEYRLLDIAYNAQAPIRTSPLDASIRLPDNTMPEPDLPAAQGHEVVLGGGMMSGMMAGMMGGRRMSMEDMMRHGMSWTINGVAASGHIHEPLLTLDHNRSYVLAIKNETAWFHPIHLHGHAFRVVSRNGRPTRHREWLDTVLIPPRESADIAFVADNPGDWMIHCHVLEHQEGGMMGTIRVA